jgi:hypothetical protein
MRPEDIATRHPHLFHLTERGGGDRIRKHGLWSTEKLLDHCELQEAARLTLLTRRRAEPVALHHGMFGPITINDNRPLSEAKLATCLDDGLSPSDWLKLLNSFVFLWASNRHAQDLLKAAGNSGRAKELLVFDALPLLRNYFERVYISPINTGATLHQPARRGLATFAPAAQLPYEAWRRRRGLSAPDKIKEVVIKDGVPDVGRYLLDVQVFEAS